MTERSRKSALSQSGSKCKSVGNSPLLLLGVDGLWTLDQEAKDFCLRWHHSFQGVLHLLSLVVGDVGVVLEDDDLERVAVDVLKALAKLCRG